MKKTLMLALQAAITRSARPRRPDDHNNNVRLR
jgi:hypothetical protein